MAEQAVIVEFEYGSNDLNPLLDVEALLISEVGVAGVGQFDGDEMAVDLSHGSFYLLGPDANALFAAARPVLDAARCLRRVRAILRFGPPVAGVAERLVTLHP